MEKRSLLGENMRNGNEEDCYGIGMELLQGASQLSRLAEREVAIL